MASPKTNAFVLIATDFGPMLVNRFDYYASPNGTWGVGYDLLNSSTYEPDMVETICDLLTVRRQHHGDGVMVLDCGANVGTFTLALAGHSHGWGNVLAFEAQERIFYALAGNVTLNNLTNARVVWTALGDAVGTIEIPHVDYLKPASFGSLELEPSRINENIGQMLNRRAGGGQVIAMTTIDHLALPRIDFIKMDVEGMEMKVLQGAMQSIRRSKPMMLLEHGKTPLEALTQLLTREGYKIIVAGRNIIALHNDDPAAAQVRVA